MASKKGSSREEGDSDTANGIGAPARRRALVVAESSFASTLHRLMQDEGVAVEWAPSSEQAQRRIPRLDHDVAVLDLDLPEDDPLPLLQALTTRKPPARVLLVAADSNQDRVRQAMELGASDRIRRPHRKEELRLQLSRFLKATPLRHLGLDAPDLLPLESIQMREVDRVLEHLARDPVLPVLVTGETGVGKESAARSLHGRSSRSDRPFVAVSCAELGSKSLRQDLFGSEGDPDTSRGLVEDARGGTLLLDEIGQMPVRVQGALLRFLEDGRFRRVGSPTEVAADVRVVATTNKEVAQEMAQGRLLRDLYYRLSAAEVRLPPLRERPDDIRSLARFFCQRASRELARAAELSEAALRILEEHPWPGNVRELRNAIRRTVLLHGGGTIGPRDLRLARHEETARPEPVPRPGSPPPFPPTLAAPLPAGSPPSLSLPVAGDEFPPLAEIERRHIAAALERTSGNRSRAARLLGISRSTLLRRLSRWDE